MPIYESFIKLFQSQVEHRTSIAEVTLHFHLQSQYNMNFIYISLHAKVWTQQTDLAPNVWLHSSVGRASHRYRGGHGSEFRLSQGIFQACSFQLLKLAIYCDDHSSLSPTTVVQYELQLVYGYFSRISFLLRHIWTIYVHFWKFYSFCCK